MKRPAPTLLRAARAVPGLYPLLAFVAARRVVVRGHSMRPALQPGERVIFDRLAYTGARPRRGDIVLARHPSRPGLILIKRVAAVPGDADPFALSAAQPQSKARSSSAESEGFEGEGRVRANAPRRVDSRALGPGEYYLLGDNPGGSTDSRQLGPFRRRDILARAWIVYWPAERVRFVRDSPQ